LVPPDILPLSLNDQSNQNVAAGAASSSVIQTPSSQQILADLDEDDAIILPRKILVLKLH